MKAAIIVQARMSSSRFPGKVLCAINKKPLLSYLLERLAKASLRIPIIIATSTDHSDDAISYYCQQHGERCLRGPLENVAVRFLKVAESLSLDAFVRLSGDSPLLDTQIVRCCLDRFLQTNCDLVTNVFPRTFPRGQSAEVIRLSTFRKACERMSNQEDLEHVTRFFYRHSEEFHIENVVSATSYSHCNLAVDYPSDLETLRRIVQAMDRPHWTYQLPEIVSLHQQTSAGAS